MAKRVMFSNIITRCHDHIKILECLGESSVMCKGNSNYRSDAGWGAGMMGVEGSVEEERRFIATRPLSPTYDEHRPLSLFPPSFHFLSTFSRVPRSAKTSRSMEHIERLPSFQDYSRHIHASCLDSEFL
jgi:hypothetical protein